VTLIRDEVIFAPIQLRAQPVSESNQSTFFNGLGENLIKINLKELVNLTPTPNHTNI